MDDISLGFSPCPNDTFIFHALVHGLVASSVAFSPPVLEDVETLNRWAMEGRLDVTKLSFHALGYLNDRYCLLRSGSALGRGCGPLLIAATTLDFSRAGKLKIAIPGRYTTAAMLLRLYAPDCGHLVEMRFERIMEAVLAGEVDCGVIIHESRFTYERLGLVCLEDLGRWWEQSTGLPIPLGCIAARRDLGREKIAEIDRSIGASLEAALADPQLSLSYIRSHSQELELDIIAEHIDLYVNEYSRDLGTEGKAAVETFLRHGREAGFLPAGHLPLILE